MADYEGSLYIISGDGSCLETVQLHESSMTPVLSADLIPMTADLELLIATNDGTLMCLRMANETGKVEAGLVRNEREWSAEAWHADTPTYNKFTNWDDKVGCSI